MGPSMPILSTIALRSTARKFELEVLARQKQPRGMSAIPPLHYSRRAVLRTLALTLGATALPALSPRRSSLLAATSPTPTPTATPIASSSLGANMSLVTGAGGNIVRLGGDDGALVIDSGIPNAAANVLTELTKEGPIALLVNTHWHFDHAGGNEALAKSGARIIATDNCRKRLATEQYVEAVKVRTPPSPAAALPLVTFSSETALHLNGDDIRLVPVAPAHTDGDVIVRFEKADVIHGGDLFFHGHYPFVDYSSGGWLGGMVDAVKRIAELAGPKTRIVPGHGRIATLEELRNHLSFLETMFERFSKFKAEGKTVEEVLAAAPTKEFDETLGKGFMKPEPFVRIAYTSLLKHD